jgi:CheY-like chemotaxis protein
MDRRTLDRVFEPFFTTKGDKGTGLGLPTVHSIVAQNEGKIALQTEPGIGSTFTVYLPLSAAVVPAATAPTFDEVRTAAGQTILVVEDDPTVRSIVSAMLNAAGYTVLSSSSGADAVRCFEARTGAIDLVVSDLSMPGLDGRETVELIRSSAPGTRALYMSGYTEDVELLESRAPAGTAFIQKPFRQDQLAHAVRMLLDTVVVSSPAPRP